jgi:hypothetical protein
MSKGRVALLIGHCIPELWPVKMGAIGKVVRLSHVQDRFGAQTGYVSCLGSTSNNLTTHAAVAGSLCGLSEADGRQTTSIGSVCTCAGSF